MQPLFLKSQSRRGGLKSASLVIVAAALAGLAIGFALREKREAPFVEIPQTNGTSETVTRLKLSRFGKEMAASRPQDDSPLATQLERDLSMSEGVTRWLYWLEALEKATTSDFPRLARLANGNPTATRFVAARWIDVNPRHLFDTLASGAAAVAGLPVNELSSVLFNEWPKRDLEAVIAALNAQDVPSLRPWRMRVATVAVERDVERGLRLMSEWHIENYGPRMNAVAAWAASNPRHAAEFTLEHPAGYASRLAMETIGKEWARIDPKQALQFATSNRGEFSSALASSVLKDWTGRDINAAADWLAGTDAPTRNRLSTSFVEEWAKQDASGALAWCQRNLTGSSLASAVGGVMKGAAEKDLDSAATLVAAMPPSQARTEAALAVAAKWFPSFNSNKAVKPETIKWLGSLDSNSAMRVLDRIQWGWATSDPQSMAAFLAESSGDRIPSSAASLLARELARTNPAEAVEWASRLPADRAILAGSEAFSEWRRSQPKQASKWLQGLPETDIRRRPFFENSIRSLAHDPYAMEQFASMTPPERAMARGIIETMPIPNDQRARLLEVLKPN